jgi:hypothetical protein
MTGIATSFDPSKAALGSLAVLEHVLTHDDGVVDDDAEHQQEREQRDQVDGDVEHRHQHHGAHERDRDAEPDPQGEPELQEQRQQQHHEHEALGCIREQQVDAAAQDHRLVAPGAHRDTLGQHRLAVASHPVAHGLGDLERVLVAHAEHLEEHGRFAVEPREQVVIGKPVDHDGDLAQRDTRAVLLAEHHQLLEVRSRVGLRLGADEGLARLGLDAACGQVQRGPAYRRRDLVEGEAVLLQPFLGHLDRDLVGPHPVQLHLRDAGQRRERVARALAEGLERAFVGTAADRHADDLLADDEA